MVVSTATTMASATTATTSTAAADTIAIAKTLATATLARTMTTAACGGALGRGRRPTDVHCNAPKVFPLGWPGQQGCVAGDEM